jgi:hypothetical protein
MYEHKPFRQALEASFEVLKERLTFKRTAKKVFWRSNHTRRFDAIDVQFAQYKAVKEWALSLYIRNAH